MGKKKVYKDDGVTEDFEAESKEIDEQEAAPGLLDDAGSESESASEDAAPVSDELAPAATDEKAEPVESAHTPAELEPSQVETGNVEPGVEAKDAPAEPAAEPAEAPKAEPAAESAAPAAEEPAAFGDLHSDISELADHLGSEALDEMKKAGDALTPAVSKLHGIEQRLEHLGDEAKARFVHAKNMLVHAMAALERLFHRG